MTLTIDRDLQRATAEALSDAFNYAAANWAQYSPGGAAIVMDVNTGAILALASYPGFDPALFDPNSAIPSDDRINAINALSTSQLRQPLRNHATQDQYFPGSTFKIITTAATANEDLISPTELFNCDLRWDGRPYGDTREFRIDWRSTDGLDPAGEITISQALAASCNPFFYQFGALLYRDVGFQALMDYARRMGLGAATGLAPVMQEADAELPTIDNPEEAIMSAVGQYDVQVTAIQMVRMMAGVANGGTLYRPYIVQQVGGVDGQPVTFEAEPTVVGNMDFAPEVYQVIRDGLCLATTDETLGTSWFVFEDMPYTVCGKTGTAQTGTPYPNGWFVAYAPADDPQVAIIAVVPNSREGSETAAPIVRRILDHYFNAPIADFPDWWFNNTYNVLDLPEGSTGG
ncbi:MAG: penicillin-binding transpeptidase domain-containing protein [Anaerolineae bacterium]